MRIISGLQKPTSGTVDYGFDHKKLGNVGALVELPSIYSNQTARENLVYQYINLGLKIDDSIEKSLQFVGLGNTGSKKAGKFSLGMRQRLGIAMAMSGNPEVLILDEPINGLDPQGIVEIREMLMRLNSENGVTILISSHILEELAKIATDYAIINEGSIIEESTSEELKTKCRDKIVIKSSDVSGIVPVIDGSGFKDYQVIDDHTIFVFDRITDSAMLNMEIAKAGFMVDSIGVESSDLEEYFLKVTGSATGDIR
jgi:ABC-2 type transport system ATP-binding protein